MTATGTIVFLLVASALVSLAIHVVLQSQAEAKGRSRAGATDAERARNQRTFDRFSESIEALQIDVEGLRGLQGVDRKLSMLEREFAKDRAQGDANSGVNLRLDAVAESVQAVEARIAELGALSGVDQKLRLLERQFATDREDWIQEKRVVSIEERMEALAEAVSALGAQAEQPKGAEVDASRMDRVESDVAAFEDAVSAMTGKHEQMESRMGDVQERFASISARVEGFQAGGVDADELESLRRDVGENTRRIDELGQELNLVVAEVDRLSAKDSAREVEEAASARAAREVAACDLKRIRGIGVVLEKTLKEAGINRIEQVANLSIDQVEVLSQRLENFSGRIEREQWVEQAKELVAADARSND